MKELKKILYVEDDVNVAKIVQIALENIGNFDIRHCLNGKDALEVINDFEPDLILTDVMMPEMDGPELLKSIREKSKYTKTPVVFITARAQTDEIKEYLSLGASDVIIKPFDPVIISDQLLEIWKNFYKTE